jgi:SAM-dependent methyltransferase
MKNHNAIWHLLFFLLLPLSSYSQEEKIDSAEIERERIRWNKSLTRDTAYKFNKNPNTLLVETAKGLKPGKALDIGMGQGRNSIFLAKNGWTVTGVDIADEAVAFALKQAKENKVTIEALVTPMETFDFGLNKWDLIVHVYEGCFDEARVTKILKALKPGGRLLFEFFHREAGIEMKRPTFGCETNETKTSIEQAGGFKILRYTEEVGIADYSLKKYKLVKLVAVKK